MEFIQQVGFEKFAEVLTASICTLAVCVWLMIYLSKVIKKWLEKDTEYKNKKIELMTEIKEAIERKKQ